MLDKQEVYNFLCENSNKQNPLVRESTFSKLYTELYKEFKQINFLENLPFRQLLWHFLRNDIELKLGLCPICGKRCKFDAFSVGYGVYCSKKCDLLDRKNIAKKSEKTKEIRYGDPKYNNSSKAIETNLKIYGVRSTSQLKEVRDKMVETRIKNNGGVYETPEQTQKRKNTCLERFGYESNAQSEESKLKQAKTCEERYNNKSFLQSQEYKDKMNNIYGCEHSLQNKEILNKRLNTSRERHSFNTSKIEKEFSQYLLNNNFNFIQQYKSNEYPFACDFYLVDYDLYVEIHGFWTHGFHPFDKTNPEDIKKLNKWKSKNNDFYNNAIYVWTDLDVKKLKISQQNNLNYLPIYSIKINDCINQFKNKIKELKN